MAFSLSRTLKSIIILQIIKQSDGGCTHDGFGTNSPLFKVELHRLTDNGFLMIKREKQKYFYYLTDQGGKHLQDLMCQWFGFQNEFDHLINHMDKNQFTRFYNDRNETRLKSNLINRIMVMKYISIEPAYCDEIEHFMYHLDATYVGAFRVRKIMKALCDNNLAFEMEKGTVPMKPTQWPCAAERRRYFKLTKFGKKELNDLLISWGKLKNILQGDMKQLVSIEQIWLT